MEQDDVGLGDLSSEEMSIDSDRDSVIDSEEDKDGDKSSLTSDEDEEEEDEEEDSDIFGESDKDDNEDRKSSTGPSSFADELAARIKGEVPNKPEEDHTFAADDDEMFNPSKTEDEDYSPFGGRGGLFSGGRGLFDDDDE
ncbi:hypothetical protein JZ751_013925, partial [Albula glossodonta]